MSLMLGNKSFAVVGVLPVDMDGLSIGRFDVWAPVSVDPDQNLGRHLRNRQVYARLKHGVSISEAQGEMTAIADRLAEAYPTENKGWGVTMRLLYAGEVGSVRPALLTFFGAVTFVLLIACANIANLQLARAAQRRKELAIRTALGASRLQLIRQLLIENVVLAILGGCCGLVLAYWAIDLLVALTPRGVPRLQQVRMDGTVLGFTLLVTLMTGILYGLAPAVQSSRINLTENLKAAQKFAARGLGLGLQSLLVICQIALALILLVGAGLLSRSFLRLTSLDPGFNPKNLLTVQLFPPASKYKSREQVAEFYKQVIRELKLVPGVNSVGASSAGPQFGGWEPVEILPGDVPSAAGEYPQVRYYDVGPDYFRTMEIPIRSGREFTDNDNQNAPPVAMINETLARRYWPNEDPIGKRLNLVRRNKSMEIIGIVGDVQRFDADSKIEPEIYWPYLQEPRWATYFVLRTDSDATGAASAIRKRVIGLDKDVFVSSVRPMDRLISSSLQDPRFNVLVIGIFAFLALLLASVGLYAVVAYSVVQQTREIGIRIALGAERRDVLNLIIKRGVSLAIVGLSIGLVCSFVLTRFISSLLFGVSPTDSAALLGVSLLLLSVAVIASYIPAKRATRIDPIAALRHE
jgi:putative ABC transport system permease protein